MFNMWMKSISLLSVSELDAGASFNVLIYSRRSVVILGSNILSWLTKCLTTVVLEECFLSKM